MNMKRLLILLIAVVSFTLSEGQESDPLKELENSALQIRQKPGTDRLLAEWLAEAGVTEDTIYAYIFTPASCPRCESGIKPYMEEFKSKGKKFMLISVMRDKEAAMAYNKRKGYAADYYIYDTTNRYKNIFSFNNIALNSPDLLKITRSGRMITGYDANFISPARFARLYERTEPMEYKDFGGNTEDDAEDWLYPVSAQDTESLTAWTDYKLGVTKEAPLGQIYRNPYFKDDMFYYPDELLGGVPVFTRKAGTGEFGFRKLLLPSEDKKDRFVNIPDYLYKMKKAEGSIHYIICNAWALDSTHIGMSYSLPRIYMEDSVTLAYFNQPCILSRRTDGFAEDSCTVLDFKPYYDKYMFQHFQFSSTGDKIIIGLIKDTWPTETPTEEYKGKTDIDPFMDGFYDTDNPIMAAFDRRTGKLVQTFGHLDDVARKTLTGYYFTDMLSVVGGGELAYTDSYSGKVYVADTADLAREKACYEAFSIDEKLLPPADTAKYVELGAADVGFSGKDILEEDEPDVYELLDLGIGKCRMCVAAKSGYKEDAYRSVKVATKFVNVARKYYAKTGRDAEIIKLNGSIELAPILGLSDVIVDIVETGTTLRENDLKVTETIFEISTRLIVNKASYKFKYDEIAKMVKKLKETMK